MTFLYFSRLLLRLLPDRTYPLSWHIIICASCQSGSHCAPIVVLIVHSFFLFFFFRHSRHVQYITIIPEFGTHQPAPVNSLQVFSLISYVACSVSRGVFGFLPYMLSHSCSAYFGFSQHLRIDVGLINSFNGWANEREKPRHSPCVSVHPVCAYQLRLRVSALHTFVLLSVCFAFLHSTWVLVSVS